MDNNSPKIKVSIGIPAYNEEANIGHLLRSLLNQKGDNFVLEEIIVVSDASTDRTADVVMEVKDKRIKLLINDSRQGQALSQNRILDNFCGDSVLLLNADVVPADDNFVAKIVEPITMDSRIGIVSPKVVPLPAENFFESVINYSASIKNSIFSDIKLTTPLYLCHGRARALSKSFANSLRWVATHGEDAYSYLKAIESGYLFEFQDSATVYYKSPNNLSDHLKQSARFINSRKNLEKFFPKDLVRKEYSIPKRPYIKNLVKFFFYNPIFFFLYACIHYYVKLHPARRKFGTHVWPISDSSKVLK